MASVMIAGPGAAMSEQVLNAAAAVSAAVCGEGIVNAEDVANEVATASAVAIANSTAACVAGTILWSRSPVTACFRLSLNRRLLLCCRHHAWRRIGLPQHKASQGRSLHPACHDFLSRRRRDAPACMPSCMPTKTSWPRSAER